MENHQYPSFLKSCSGWADYFDARRTRLPHVHQIEPTNHCPYACVMCPRDQLMTRKLGFMEMSLYSKVIDEISGYSEPVRSKEVELFHFGESLLHPQIDEMIGYASDRGLNMVLSVNAPQLTPQMADRILAQQPKQLIISLDGHDAETYKALRGPNADYNTAVDNLEHLATRLSNNQYSTKVCVRIIRLNANANQLNVFEEFWQEKGLDVEVRPFFPWTEKDMTNLGEVEKYPPGMPCPFPWEYLVVQWDGKVVPCCRDYNSNNVMGDVRLQSLEEIWNSVTYAEFRDQHRCGNYLGNRFCEECMGIFYTEPNIKEVSELLLDNLPSDHDTLAGLWRSSVSKYTDRTLVVDAGDGSRFSYADANEVVSQISTRLRQVGLTQGDRLVVCAYQHVEAALLFWAAMNLGVTFVPLDPRLPPGLINDIICEVDPRLLVCDLSMYDSLRNTQELPLVVFDDLEDQPIDQAPRFAEWIGDVLPAATESMPVPGDPAVILFTSGTSGRPKGVVLNHGALYRSGALMAKAYRWQEDDLLWSLGDFHTMSGLRNPLIATLHAGASFLIAQPEIRCNALVVSEGLRCHDVSVLATVPAMLRQFLKVSGRLESQPLGSVRQLLCTGSVLAPEVDASFRKQFMVPIYNYYGLTETSGLCLGNIPGRRAEAGAVGWPIGSNILIADEDGLAVPDGDVGELVVYSNNLMTGYFNKTLPHSPGDISHDCYATGDLACRNSDGSISLVGRKGDMIKDVRGELLHPSEIEQCLERHSLVEEAGVCGFASPEGEERFTAFIVPTGSAFGCSEILDEIRQNLFEMLGPTRLPTRFQLVAGLPRNNSGKLLRSQLLELLNEE